MARGAESGSSHGQNPSGRKTCFPTGTLLLSLSEDKDFEVVLLQSVVPQFESRNSSFTKCSVNVLLNFVPFDQSIFYLASHFPYSRQPSKQRKYQPEKMKCDVPEHRDDLTIFMC